MLFSGNRTSTSASLPAALNVSTGYRESWPHLRWLRFHGHRVMKGSIHRKRENWTRNGAPEVKRTFTLIVDGRQLVITEDNGVYKTQRQDVISAAMRELAKDSPAHRLATVLDSATGRHGEGQRQDRVPVMLDGSGAVVAIKVNIRPPSSSRTPRQYWV